MAIKEFEFGARESESEDEIEAPITFKVDGEEWKAYQPTSGQVAIWFSVSTDRASSQERIAGIIDFFLGVLDDVGRHSASRKLMDREDDFEIEQLMEIMSWLMEQWSARPTESSSASTPSRRTGGRKSTASSRVVESTPSGSRSLVSAT